MTPSPPPGLTIHEALCPKDGTGAVQRGRNLTHSEAVAHRQNEGDVVVCGPDTFANARSARDRIDRRPLRS